MIFHAWLHRVPWRLHVPILVMIMLLLVYRHDCHISSEIQLSKHVLWRVNACRRTLTRSAEIPSHGIRRIADLLQSCTAPGYRTKQVLRRRSLGSRRFHLEIGNSFHYLLTTAHFNFVSFILTGQSRVKARLSSRQLPLCIVPLSFYWLVKHRKSTWVLWCDIPPVLSHIMHNYLVVDQYSWLENQLPISVLLTLP